MELKKYILSLGSICFFVCGVAHAQPSADANLQRRLNQEIQTQQAKVEININWEKEIHMRDVMSRPPRMGAGNPVIGVKQDTTTCQGVLLEGNTRIALPAVCFKNGNFEIKQLRLSFSNGRQATGTKSCIYTQDDMGYIRIEAQTAQSLRGVPVGVLKPGKSLQDTFGSAMTMALHRFFSSHGIAFRTRVCRIGSNRYRCGSLKTGEPVFFEGKLVALVKYAPSRYSTVWGKVSEDALAVFRS